MYLVNLDLFKCSLKDVCCWFDWELFVLWPSLIYTLFGKTQFFIEPPLIEYNIHELGIAWFELGLHYPLFAVKRMYKFAWAWPLYETIKTEAPCHIRHGAIDWLIDWLIDCIVFYAVSAIFQPCKGGRTDIVYVLVPLM